jgi:hypothetical protein
MANPKKGVRTKRTRKHVEAEGIAHIKATFNNTLVTITDMQGNVVTWGSSGKAGFKGSKKDDDDEPPVSMGGCCAICSCTRADPCERMVDDKKQACVRGSGEELCNLCEEIADTVDAAVEGKTHPFRFEEIFAAVLSQEQVEDTDGDRDVVRECLGRMIEDETIEQLEDSRYRRLE